MLAPAAHRIKFSRLQWDVAFSPPARSGGPGSADSHAEQPSVAEQEEYGVNHLIVRLFVTDTVADSPGPCVRLLERVLDCERNELAVAGGRSRLSPHP
jgi:hypothetical protein